MRSLEPSITTFTGRSVYPLNLRPENVCLEDVAHHLATLNRFVGALRKPVSIAHHAVYVSRLLSGTGFELHGLHHDDAEAYLGDLSKWVKQDPRMKAYRDAEEDAQSACDTHFGIVWTPEAHERVRWADTLMVRFEAERGFKNGCDMFVRSTHPHTTEEERDCVGAWGFWSWKTAEEAFLIQHAMLVRALLPT